MMEAMRVAAVLATSVFAEMGAHSPLGESEQP
jgi:hypothetical protein